MVAEPHFLDLTRRIQSQPQEKNRLNVRLDVPGGVSFAPDRLNPHNSAKRVFRVPQLPEPAQLFYDFEREIAEHDGVPYVPSSSFVIGEDDELTPSQKIAQDVREKYESATGPIKSGKSEDDKMELLLDAMNLEKGSDEKESSNPSDLRSKDPVSNDALPETKDDYVRNEQITSPESKNKSDTIVNEDKLEKNEPSIEENSHQSRSRESVIQEEANPMELVSGSQNSQDGESKPQKRQGEKSQNPTTNKSVSEDGTFPRPSSPDETPATEEINAKVSNTPSEKKDNVSSSESRRNEKNELGVDKEVQKTGTSISKSGMTKSQAKRAKEKAKKMARNQEAICKNERADERSDLTNTSNEDTNFTPRNGELENITDLPEESKDQNTSQGSGINHEVDVNAKINETNDSSDNNVLDHLKTKMDGEQLGEEHDSMTEKKIESRHSAGLENEDMFAKSSINSKVNTHTVNEAEDAVHNLNVEVAEIRPERPADAMSMQTARTQLSTFAPTVSGFSVLADKTRQGGADGLPAVVRKKLNLIDYKLPPSISDGSYAKKPWNNKSYLKSRAFERLASQPEGRDAGTQWNAINGPGEEALAFPSNNLQSITFETLSALFIPDPRHWHPYRFVRRTNPRQVLLMCAGTALTQKQLQTSELARKVASGQMGPINDAKSLASYFTTTENTSLQGGLGFVYSPNEALCHAMHEKVDLERSETNFSRRLERPEFPNETTKRRAALRSVIAALEYIRWEEEGFDKIVIATHHGWIVRGIAYEYVAREKLTLQHLGMAPEQLAIYARCSRSYSGW